MPQYLAPGVYIEEVSFRSKSIEGASTTTTGFIGPTRYGPIDLDNELITSLGDFKRIYGDGEQLEFGTSFLHNYTWHAARGFFAEGGRQLYISRCFRRIDTETSEGQDLAIVDTNPTQVGTLWADGHARGRLSATAAVDTSLQLRARWPGEFGNLSVRLFVHVGQNL